MEIAAGVAVGLVFGIPLTLAGTYYFWVLQRKRLVLGYEVLSANVLIPGPPETTPDIKIMVRQRLIDQDAEHPEEFAEVDEVLGFRVLLRNCGNEPLEGQVATMDLDEPAIVLSASIEEEPELGDERINISSPHGAPHRARVHIPFLNPGDEITISLQSIQNREQECNVIAGAPGLRTYDLGARRRIQAATIGALVAVLLISGFAAAMTLAIIYGGDDAEPRWVLPAQWSALGAVALLMLAVIPIVRILRPTV